MGHLPGELIQDLQKAIESIPEGGDIMPTIAEQWIEEGYKKGIKQGLLSTIKAWLEVETRS